MPRYRRPLCIQAYDTRRACRQKPRRGLLRQHNPRLRVRQHVRQPLRRIRRIQRHIGPARLQHPKQTHKKRQRALQRNPHQNLRSNPQISQKPRQPVRPSIKLRITQPLFPAHTRHSLRRTRRLRLEQQMQTLRLPLKNRRRVPLLQDAPPLLSAQQRQPPNRHFRIRGDPLKQHAVMRSQPRNASRIEQVGVVFETAAQIRRRLPQRDPDVENRRSLVNVQRRSGMASAVRCWQVQQLKRDLEERIAAQIALWLHLLNKHLERTDPGGHTPPQPCAAPAPAPHGSVRSPRPSVRITSVLTKNPISPSTSVRLRPAIGVPTTMSSCPL